MRYTCPTGPFVLLSVSRAATTWASVWARSGVVRGGKRTPKRSKYRIRLPDSAGVARAGLGKGATASACGAKLLKLCWRLMMPNRAPIMLRRCSYVRRATSSAVQSVLSGEAQFTASTRADMSCRVCRTPELGRTQASRRLARTSTPTREPASSSERMRLAAISTARSKGVLPGLPQSNSVDASTRHQVVGGGSSSGART